MCIRDSVILARQIERFAEFGRSQDSHSLLLIGVQRLHHSRGVDLAAEVVKLREQPGAALQAVATALVNGEVRQSLLMRRERGMSRTEEARTRIVVRRMEHSRREPHKWRNRRIDRPQALRSD